MKNFIFCLLCISVQFLLITNLTHFFNVFISLLYMFRATQCSSSGESIVSIHHLVYIALFVCVCVFVWASVMQVRDLHTRRPHTQSDIYQMMYWYNWFSWWWSLGCSKQQRSEINALKKCAKLVINTKCLLKQKKKKSHSTWEKINFPTVGTSK